MMYQKILTLKYQIYEGEGPIYLFLTLQKPNVWLLCRSWKCLKIYIVGQYKLQYAFGLYLQNRQALFFEESDTAYAYWECTNIFVSLCNIRQDNIFHSLLVWKQRHLGQSVCSHVLKIVNKKRLFCWCKNNRGPDILHPGSKEESWELIPWWEWH